MTLKNEDELSVKSKEQRLSTLWDREYREFNVIPSSVRAAPSKPLLLYEGLLNFAQLTPVLDVGCGNGRNAIYLAAKGCNVHAVDASEVALGYARERTNAEGLADKIQFYNLVLTRHWPFPDNYFALALDAYVFCHLLNRQERETYRGELRRLLRPSGVLYSAVFCVDDEYYRELMDSNDKGNRIVLDHRNGIRKHLYTEDEFRNFFSAEFRVTYFTKFQFDDVVQGRKYRRSILTLISEK